MHHLVNSVVFLAALGFGAQASMDSLRIPVSVMPHPATMLADASPTPAPFGYALFCKRYAEHCQKTEGEAQITLNDQRRATIAAINAR